MERIFIQKAYTITKERLYLRISKRVVGAGIRRVCPIFGIYCKCRDAFSVYIVAARQGDSVLTFMSTSPSWTKRSSR